MHPLLAKFGIMEYTISYPLCEKKIIFYQVMLKKICLLLYQKLYFIVNQSTNIVLLTFLDKSGSVIKVTARAEGMVK